MPEPEKAQGWPQGAVQASPALAPAVIAAPESGARGRNWRPAKSVAEGRQI